MPIKKKTFILLLFLGIILIIVLLIDFSEKQKSNNVNLDRQALEIKETRKIEEISNELNEKQQLELKRSILSWRTALSLYSGGGTNNQNLQQILFGGKPITPETQLSLSNLSDIYQKGWVYTNNILVAGNQNNVQAEQTIIYEADFKPQEAKVSYQFQDCDLSYLEKCRLKNIKLKTKVINFFPTERVSFEEINSELLKMSNQKESLTTHTNPRPDSDVTEKNVFNLLNDNWEQELAQKQDGFSLVIFIKNEILKITPKSEPINNNYLTLNDLENKDGVFSFTIKIVTPDNNVDFKQYTVKCDNKSCRQI